MTFNEKIFNKFHEEHVGMQVEFDDDATYLETRIETISFQMPSGNVLKLCDVLSV